MTDPRYCGAETVDGRTCMVRVKNGQSCAVHRHPRPLPPLAPKPRCAGEVVGVGTPCFRPVQNEGDRCWHHQPKPQLLATVRRLRMQLEEIGKTVHELDELTRGP